MQAFTGLFGPADSDTPGEEPPRDGNGRQEVAEGANSIDNLEDSDEDDDDYEDMDDLLDEDVEDEFLEIDSEYWVDEADSVDANSEEDDDDDDEGAFSMEVLLRHGGMGRPNVRKAAAVAVQEARAAPGVDPSKDDWLQPRDSGYEDDGIFAEGLAMDFDKRRSVHDLLRDRERGTIKSHSVVPIAKTFMPNRCKSVIAKYGSRAYSGQFSEDGNSYFTCTQDFKLHLYDTSDISNIRKKIDLQGHVGQWTITDCSLSPNNEKMIYSSIAPVVWLTSSDPESEDSSQIPLQFDNSSIGSFAIWSIRFSGDGREIVAGARNNSLYVYDIETRTVLHQIRGHASDVNAVCYADPNSSHVLYSASDDSHVKIWDRRSLGRNAQPAGVFIGHTEGITYVASKGDGRYALSNGKDQHMKLWDLRRMKEPNQVKNDITMHPGYYSEEGFDYRLMPYPGDSSFRHPQDCSIQTYTGHSVLKTLIRCHFSPAHSTGQRYVYTGSTDGKIRIFSLEGELVRTLDTGAVLSSTDFRNVNLTDGPGYYDFLRPNRSNMRSVIRDVSWHPTLPYMISTAWCGPNQMFGAAIAHEYADPQL
ncbi:WD repeat protein [Fimicolochytrium jonesii]|uniref:WD repeat protein n=1 Tax=Fimicolochytrium jonesii TaxID=1396493 RepID=UPI0022FDEAA5|nr:WD repeat protein [Fimicolochytrium jonesii]KAI8823494.1 WD repeat protein [Fimicolochytrium jonesii]